MGPNSSPPFGDYQPKLTPDTVLDYRPSIRAVIEEFPSLHNPSFDKLVALLQLLEDVQAKAKKNPGHTQPGNMILGADREEYKPSDDELLESHVGDVIKGVVAGTPEELRPALAKKLKGNRTYNVIRVRHSDVMGSGRFFYASKPQPEKIQIKS